MTNIPPNNVKTNQPKEEKKLNNLDIKSYLLYVLLAVALLFVYRLYHRAVKSDQSRDYSSTISYSAVKSSKFSLMRNIFGSLSFKKTYSYKQADPARLKSRKLVLNGLLVSSGNKYALINNNIVREGEKIGDAKVLLITDQYVVLESGSIKFRLNSNNN